MSRVTRVPVSPAKATFPQWLGTSNVNNFLLTAQTSLHIRKQTQFLWLPPSPHSAGSEQARSWQEAASETLVRAAQRQTFWKQLCSVRCKRAEEGYS